MRSHPLLSLPASARRLLQASLATVATAVLLACGGGGTTSDNGATTATTVSNSGVVQNGLRALPDAYLTRRAVSYSPFRTATTQPETETEVITDTMVKQDLDLLVAGGFGLIRLFNSSEKVAARTLRLISTNHMDLKVQLGIYPNSYEYWNLSAAAAANIQSLNDAEVARGVALANSYPDIVVAVSVGNETQVDWSPDQLSSRLLAGYIRTVRSQIVQPVTTDDNYAVYAGKLPQHPAENQMSEVLAQIDFASIHSYSMLDAEYSNFADSDAWPDWDWRQTGVTDLSKRAAAMMDAAIAKTQKDYALARAYLDAKGKAALPIIIGETGWKAVDSSGSGKYKFFANPANQKMYYDRLMSWVDATKNAAGPKSAIYFEAFDEPWKAGDDKWGLFNVGRQARYVIQAKNANNLVLNAGATWVYEYKTGSVPYTESDALYYVAPTLKTAVANNFYTLYADVAKTSETLALANTPDLRWDAFGGNTAVGTFVASASAPADPVNSLQITPAPASYGWGFLFHSTSDSNENLSGFDTASGRLHFSIKTAYAGALEIGLSTDTDDRSGAEAYLRLTNGSYGYCNTNAWCDVSIPLSAFKAANPAIDLRYVLSRFIVADRFSSTGQTSQTTVLNIDNIYYSK